ncbi:MAG TPA: hypothetical protein VHD31_01740 [Candidatus Paceibacterota bacterium]|nr:hypothetical protein [Candidatus Paceibacterota bacterium]
MPAYLTLAKAPLGEFIELDGYSGLTFYKFLPEDCPGFERKRKSKLSWCLGVVESAMEDDRFSLKVVLRPCDIDHKKLNVRAHVAHARAFIPPQRKLILVLKQPGGLVRLDRQEKTDHQLPKPGLKLLRPNGDGVTLRM